MIVFAVAYAVVVVLAGVIVDDVIIFLWELKMMSFFIQHVCLCVLVL